MELKDLATIVALTLSVFNFFQSRSDQKRSKQLAFEAKRQEVLNCKIEIQAERLACLELLKNLKAEVSSKKTSFIANIELGNIDLKINEISMSNAIKNISEIIHSPKIDLDITHEKMLKMENELGEAKRAVEVQRQENLKINDFVRDVKTRIGLSI